MPEHTSAPVDKRSHNPPEERFWRRYSRHREFPISTAGSVLFHGVVVGVLVLVGIAVFAVRTPPSPLRLGAVNIAGGWDDKPEPSESAGIRPALPAEVADLHNQQPATPRQEPNLVLPKPRPDAVRLQVPSDSRIVDQNVGGFDELGRESKKLQQKLLKDLANQGGGSRGTSGDGRGPGRDAGTEGGDGPSQGSVSSRHKRLLRWTLIFNTATGDDYRRQLSALGAILAVPQPQGGYLVIRDLKQTPAKGKVEDLSAINRIFWIDEKSESVAALASALGIRPVPTRVVAFFPPSLEDDLVRKELSFRGRREEQIRDTRFEVRSEHGKYVPVVTEQGAN